MNISTILIFRMISMFTRLNESLKIFAGIWTGSWCTLPMTVSLQPTPTRTPDPNTKVEKETFFTVSASSQMNDWPAANAVNHDPTTLWTSAEMQTLGQWFKVDFGVTKIFNRITIQSSKPETNTEEGWVDDYPHITPLSWRFPKTQYSSKLQR